MTPQLLHALQRSPSMALLNLSPMNLKQFHFDKAGRRLIAEASDFGPLRDGHWWLQQLYDDACDLGIAIMSHLTGKTELFYLAEEMQHNGEFAGWVFKPVNELANIDRVEILND